MILLIQYIHFYVLSNDDYKCNSTELKEDSNGLIIVISAVQYGIETLTNKICDVTVTKPYYNFKKWRGSMQEKKAWGLTRRFCVYDLRKGTQ